MECEKCSICGKRVPAEVYCNFVTDWGKTYESCSCICDDCRRYLQERGNLSLWQPGTHSASKE